MPTGIPDRSFRGLNAARNATFCDLMVRTGLAIDRTGQPDAVRDPRHRQHRAYAPTRLPSAIAKNGSGRRIYIPATVLREVWDYIRFDRAELIEKASRRGTYDQLPDKLLVEDSEQAVIAPRAAAFGAVRWRL